MGRARASFDGARPRRGVVAGPLQRAKLAGSPFAQAEGRRSARLLRRPLRPGQGRARRPPGSSSPNAARRRPSRRADRRLPGRRRPSSDTDVPPPVSFHVRAPSRPGRSVADGLTAPRSCQDQADAGGDRHDARDVRPSERVAEVRGADPGQHPQGPDPPGTGRRGASAAAIRGAPATTVRSAAKVGPVAQARPNVIRRDAGRPEQHRREDRAERAEGPRPGARRRVLLDGPEPRLDVVTLGRAPPRLAEGNGHVSGGVTPGRPPQGWSGRPAPGRRARVIPAMRPDRPVRRAGRGSPDAPHARRRDGRRARARRATAQDRPARSGLAVADARPSGAPPLSSASGGERTGAGGCGGCGGGAGRPTPPRPGVSRGRGGRPGGSGRRRRRGRGARPPSRSGSRARPW